jgi:type VI protein secretion system component VasK
MQRGTGPIIRPASKRRPTRQQIARRRAFAVFLVVLLAFSVWQFWPAGRPQSNAADTSGRTTPTDGAGAPSPSAGTIVPGENPIKHVIFLV